MRTEPLGKFEIFAGLSEAELGEIARRCRWRSYQKNSQILGHLDTTTDVFFIAEGKVRAIIYSLSGREVTYRDIEAGGMFGEFAAIDGKERSASIVARTDCYVASLPAQAFLSVLQSHPAIALSLLRQFVSQIRSLSDRVYEFSTMAVSNRIHAELLRMARAGKLVGDEIVIEPAPTHAEIASRVSTHREAVTRELNELARQGMVERRGGALVVRDIEGLAEMVRIVRGA